MSNTHKLNVIRSAQGSRACCSQACSHFDLLDADDTYSFCRLFAHHLSWSGGLVSLPLRYIGCLEDQTLDDVTV